MHYCSIVNYFQISLHHLVTIPSYTIYLHAYPLSTPMPLLNKLWTVSFDQVRRASWNKLRKASFRQLEVLLDKLGMVSLYKLRKPSLDTWKPLINQLMQVGHHLPTSYLWCSSTILWIMSLNELRTVLTEVMRIDLGRTFQVFAFLQFLLFSSVFSLCPYELESLSNN